MTLPREYRIPELNWNTPGLSRKYGRERTIVTDFTTMEDGWWDTVSNNHRFFSPTFFQSYWKTQVKVATCYRGRMDLGIANDTAVVAASSTGLGYASARALAEEGVNVLINGRNEESLENAAESIRETAAGDVITHPGDLTKPDDISALIERAVTEFGGIDHLVTNAGGPPSGPFIDMTDEDWYGAYDLLVMSVVRLVRAASPYLEDGGGTITCITSISVKEAVDDLVLSNSVRMGVVGLEKTLSREFAPEVRANTILPGAHATDRMEYLIQAAVDRGDYKRYEESKAAWTDDIPLDTMGDPRRFGQIVAFIASDVASHINGEAITVDGGTSRSNI